MRKQFIGIGSICTHLIRLAGLLASVLVINGISAIMAYYKMAHLIQYESEGRYYELMGNGIV